MPQAEATTPPDNVVTRDSVTLAVTHFGGDGPPLLISHATGMNAAAYRPLAANLGTRFDVWALDHRGHGRSSVPNDGDFGWHHMADDLLAVVDHLGLDSIAGFGHSMGGTALLLADKARPGVIDAAYLFEPIVFPRSIVPQNSLMAQAALKRRRSFPSKDAALARYASRPPLGLLRADSLAGYVDGGFVDTPDGTVALACSPESEAATFDNAGTDVDDISGVSTRALIAAGQALQDPSPAQFAPATAAALPNGSFKQYTTVGHFGPLQLPDLIAADAAEFLLS